MMVDLMTEREAATLVIPEALEGLEWQEHRLRLALYDDGLPELWSDALALLKQARRKMLLALADEGEGDATN